MIARKSASFRKSTSSSSTFVQRRLLVIVPTTMMMMMMTILLVIFPRACLANVIASSSSSNKPASYHLTPQQIIDYQKDGVIVIRKMLQGEVLEGAITAANKIQRSRGISRRILYRMFPAYRTLSFQTYREHKALKKVAFDSTASTISAKLMGLDHNHDHDHDDDDEKRGGGGGGGVLRHDNNHNNIKVEYNDDNHVHLKSCLFRQYTNNVHNT